MINKNKCMINKFSNTIDDFFFSSCDTCGLIKQRGLLDIPKMNIRCRVTNNPRDVKRPIAKREWIMWPGPRKTNGEGVRSSAGARCKRTAIR